MEEHNTLALNPGRGADQAMAAVAPIVELESSPDDTRAVVDLSAAYAAHAWHVLRTFIVQGASRVAIVDAIMADMPAKVWWLAHTPAAMDLAPDDRTAMLRLDGVRNTRIAGYFEPRPRSL